MNKKYFKSSTGQFELYYPNHWTPIDEGEGTYLFLDKNDWKGNLRITALRRKSIESVKNDLNEELKRPNSKLIKLVDKDAVFWFKEFLEQDGSKLIMYNWAISDKETLLACSFVTDKNKLEQEQVKKELEFVIDTLKTIKAIQ